MAHAPDRETVLLIDPTGGEPFVASVPGGAALHDVPRRDEYPEQIRGATFTRTGGMDRAVGLALFRRRNRQV